MRRRQRQRVFVDAAKHCATYGCWTMARGWWRASRRGA